MRGRSNKAADQLVSQPMNLFDLARITHIATTGGSAQMTAAGCGHVTVERRCRAAANVTSTSGLAGRERLPTV